MESLLVEDHAQLPKQQFQNLGAIAQARKLDPVLVDVEYAGMGWGNDHTTECPQFVAFAAKELNELRRVFNGAGVNDHIIEAN